MTNSETAQKKNKIYNVLIVILIILLILIIGTVFYLYKSGTDNKALSIELKKLVDISSDDKGDELEHLEYYLIDGIPVQKKFKDIYLKNTDFIGWIKSDDTPIDNPVMQTPDDPQYYIRRDFEKNYNVGGTLFIDEVSNYKKPSDNMIMYGHHMVDNSMFRSILNYEDEEYYKKHKYITFDTLVGNATYEVIACFRTQVYEHETDEFKYYEFYNAFDKEEYDEFIKNCKNLTPYKIDTTATYGDKLLTLSTCAYHVKNGRYVVVCKRIKHKEIDETDKPIDIITSDSSDNDDQ